MSGSLALSVLGGGGVARSTADPASAVLAFRRATAPGAEQKGVAQIAKDASVKLALSRFTEGIARAKTVEAALRDPRVSAVLMPALGLPDAVGSPGLVMRALLSDPADPKSLASKLAVTDARWKSAASTLNLAKRGLEGLRDAGVQKTLTEAYTAYQWRLSRNEEAAGISDALYFQQRAGTGKPLTAYEVLGDAVLRRVVTGALGLPQTIAIQEVETQARAITSRIDLSKLADPRQATKLAERYVMTAAGGGMGGSGSGLLSLFA
ncbi:DUF1217 domain-containing protein [Roseomonas sp. SSH11]|uniref:DUF1217 domain-containing protein n=1 Tax=Pararoseomonas baculiformis TaxID=2820812 RepID=A0ABS4AEQ6_9PROT|nr:DUF1217 domain-containing protein [Pararoseomonas baculiformis]MBP0445506.1 DUF1217 domain-containing protein [Pararoseomonas baculiformis]